MGFFNKLMFWKRDDDSDSDDGPGYEYDSNENGPRTEVPPWSEKYTNQEMNPASRGQEWNQGFQQNTQTQTGGTNEIVLARLDVINAKLDSLNQRLANLERYAAEEDKKPGW